MSIAYIDEIKCPCGEQFEAEVVQSVSVSQNPELKDLVLAGEFNVVRCPSCSQMLYAERFLLYHDPAQELLAFVYPKEMESKREGMLEEMAKSFLDLQNSLSPKEKFSYKPFLIFGLDALCDLIKLEDDITDEMQVAELLCDSLKLQKKRVHRDIARRKNIVPLIPVNSSAKKFVSEEFRRQTIEGLKKVIESNDALEHYKQFLSKIESEPQWTLESADFIL